MASGGVEIGDFEEGDIDQIMVIERDAFASPWSEELFRREIGSSISRLIVARLSRNQGRRVVGYAVYWSVADEIHLHTLAVRRDRRREGIGSLLLGEIIHCSRSLGAKWITLEVRQRNDAARRLYAKFGFSVQGSRPGYYHDTGEDALILWADLELGDAESANKGEGRNG